MLTGVHTFDRDMIPQKSPTALSPLSIGRILYKNIVSIIAVAATGSAISFVIIYQLPAAYRSEAVILVDSQKIPERYVSSTVNSEVQDRLATITQQILSTTRLLNVIKDFGLYKDEGKALAQEEIIERMRKDISIKLETGWTRERLGAFRVGYQGKNPALVAEVANRLANLFIDENLRTRERQAEGTADFIDSQLQTAKNTLDAMEERIRSYKVTHTGDLPEQQPALNGTLTRLQLELQGNQDAINRSQQNKVILQGTLDLETAGMRSNSIPGSRSEPSSSSSRQKESDYLQLEYDSLLKQFQPKHPRMIALQRKIERQRAYEQLSEEKEDARIDNVKSQVALIDREISQLNSNHDRILRSIADYQARIERLPVREQEMAALTRDYELSKANYKSLLDKKLAAGMATDMERRQQGERFTMLDAARVPERPFSPKRPQLCGTGCALSLALSLTLAFIRELKKNTLLGEWELPSGIGVLGRVPFIPCDPPGRKWTAVLLGPIRG